LACVSQKSVVIGYKRVLGNSVSILHEMADFRMFSRVFIFLTHASNSRLS
jgi:hypothetical protein